MDEWLASRPFRFTPGEMTVSGTHSIGVRKRWRREKSSLPLQRIEPRTSSTNPSPYTEWPLPARSNLSFGILDPWDSLRAGTIMAFIVVIVIVFMFEVLNHRQWLLLLTENCHNRYRNM